MKLTIRAACVALLVASVSTTARAADRADQPTDQYCTAGFGDTLMIIGAIGMAVGILFLFTAKLLMKKAVVPIKGVGELAGSQMSLMQIAGMAIIGIRYEENPSQAQITDSARQGHKRLKTMTGRDFGMNVEQWFEFLTASAPQYRFHHPQGYEAMRTYLESRNHHLPWKTDLEEAN